VEKDIGAVAPSVPAVNTISALEFDQRRERSQEIEAEMGITGDICQYACFGHNFADKKTVGLAKGSFRIPSQQRKTENFEEGGIDIVDTILCEPMFPVFHHNPFGLDFCGLQYFRKLLLHG